MDCDLQHPASLIPEMYRLWKEGFEVIEGIKSSRGKETPLHTFCARTFYRIISKVTAIDMSHASDFKLLEGCGCTPCHAGTRPLFPRLIFMGGLSDHYDSF